MRVFLLAMGFDTAGQLAALGSALRQERPAWTVDQMRRWSKFFAYPTQREYDESLARRLWIRADVVHVNLSLLASRVIGRDRPRPLVLHHHGTEYRNKREAIDAACRSVGAVQVASTLDLLGSPGVAWLPVVVDVDSLAALRSQGHGVRVAHSPTDPALKGTDALRAAMRGLPAELDVIEGVPWAECLARKGLADVFVDQLDLGYGLSAVEAWAMGIPVVAGVTEPAVRARMVETFGDLPFVEATADTLPDVLAWLVDDATARRDWGERGRAHVERFHSQRAVVDRLEPIYQQALA